MPVPGVQYPAGGTMLLPVTLTGEGLPGAQVLARDVEGREMGSTTVGPDGAWTLVPEPGAPGESTVYSVRQEVDGQFSEPGEATDEYVFLAPRFRSPDPGEEVEGGSVWVVVAYDLEASQEYALLIDGQRYDRPAQGTGTLMIELYQLGSGSHTLELAYRDPETGRLGARDSVTFVVT